MSTKTIVYFRNGLGNFILMTPVIRALASLDQSGKVDICIDSEWNDNRRQSLIDIIKAIPFIEDLINYPVNIFEKDYKVWFWTRHTYPSRALEVFKSKDCRFDLNPAWQAQKIHEIDFYMTLVRRFCGYEGKTPKQFFPVSESVKVDNDKYIVLCNGSYGHLALSKKWDKFGALAKVLHHFYPEYKIVKIGYQSELEDVKDVSEIDYVNKLSIIETASVIKNCSVLITTDTCNMHIGDTLEIPMIVLWGGSLLTKNSPVNGKAIIINKQIKCQPCHEININQSCEYAKCLGMISVGDVMSEVRSVLGD